MRKINKLSPQLKTYLKNVGIPENMFRMGNIEIWRCQTLREMKDNKADMNNPYIVNSAGESRKEI